jgi:hypothetical protein
MGYSMVIWSYLHKSYQPTAFGRKPSNVRRRLGLVLPIQISRRRHHVHELNLKLISDYLYMNKITLNIAQSFVFPAFLSWEIRFRHFSLGFDIKHWISFRKLYYLPKLIKNAKTQRTLKLPSSIYRALVYYQLGLDKPR